MAMKLDKVVPFGRSFDEYQKMFNLSDIDLQKRILGVGDGPASFNAEATQRGHQVISVDPIYQLSAKEIERRFNEVLDNIIDQIKSTPGDWSWSYHKSPEDLRQNRIKVMQIFIADYEKGKQLGRYQTGALPLLNFNSNEFEMTLCSHLLFLYSDYLDLQFHLDSIAAMLNISQEVRIFPLLTLMLQRSPHLDPVIEQCRAEGYIVSIEEVAYELQKGGNEMLCLRKVATS